MQRQEKGSRLLLEVDLRYVTNQMRPLIRDEINVILQTSLIHRNTLAFIKKIMRVMMMMMNFSSSMML